MARTKAFVPGQRIRRTDTGVEATYIGTPSKSRVYEVLLDDGPKQATTWSKEVPVEPVGVVGVCPRCFGEHHPFYCPGE